LVLDLRGNEGGLDAGNSILERLIVRPIALPFYHRFVRAGSVPERLRAVLDTWDRTFFDLGTQAQASPDPRFRRLTRWDGSDTGAVLVRPRGRRFAGKVWVIVGAENSSATFQFALAVKQSGVATLVGQPTGGNRRGINGGAFFFVRLPRTGLEVDLPLIAGFPTTDEPDAGVEPDVLVQPNTGDIAARRDAELEAIRQRIRSGSR
jgi:C-terminal processing protease CtpA/Prc